MAASRRSRTRSRRARRRLSESRLAGLSDEELLGLRMCDLGVEIEGTSLQERIQQLYEELEARDVRFRPHFWLSDEWFSPDGVPGIAIPFYLAHPRLMRLERRQVLEVEGGTREWCMQILRHEAGHAIDTAYRLRRTRRWREVFGRTSLPYPQYYKPKPNSRSFVLHLGGWYAQSHPTEDFAETFAVWLKPRARWRSEYRGWPAIKKLEFVDEVIRGIGHEKPKVVSRTRVYPLRAIRKTLADHYRSKRAHYGLDHPGSYDADLQRLFSSSPEYVKNASAAAFLRQARRELRTSVARWTGAHQYTIDQVLDEMIERCRQLKLRLASPEDETGRGALIMLSVQTMDYLHGGSHRVAL